MILSQRFNIIGLELISSGNAEYYTDTDTGSTQCKATITASHFIFSKTFTENEDYQLDPKFLLSSSIKPGDWHVFGPVLIDILSVNNLKANIGIKINGDKITGTGLLDLSEQFIKIINMNFKGVVSGYQFEMNIIPK
jgi:hypothetical protein